MTMISDRLLEDLARALKLYVVATKTIVVESLTRLLKASRAEMHLDEVMPGVR